MAALCVALWSAPIAHPTPQGARNENDERIDRVKEYGVKAGFLANFIKYTKWPEESFPSESSPIVIAVVGTSRYASVIERSLAGRKIGQRKVDVVVSETLPDKAQAHVVFASEIDDKRAALILRACASRPVLLIGEQPDFALRGAGLNFYLDGGKIRFEANPDALRRNRLQVSSELLKLARIIKEEKR